MAKTIKSMEQLRDSRLMFEKKIPLFGYMIFWVIVLTLIGIVIWSTKAHKPYVIVTQGRVTSSTSSEVTSVYGGEIEECFMEEGQVVQEGDILFTIKSTDYNLQEEQLKANRKIYEKQVELAQLLVQSVKDDKNYFDISNPEHQLYYSMFEAYKSQVIQNTFDGSTYEAYGYTEEQIEAELIKNQGKLSEIYYAEIQMAENLIKEAEEQIASIDAQLIAVEHGQDAYYVKATGNGTVHMLADYKVGSVVQSGTPVATITPDNAEVVVEAYVTTSDMTRMKENDKVQIAVDGLIQSAYGNITGSVSSIDSDATSIQSESGSVNSAFKIEINPNINYLVSKSGRKVNLANGMTVEARIIYDEITYFDYVMEQLGLLVR